MDEESIVVRHGVSKKNGREWFAIVQLRPQFEFVPKSVYDAIVASGRAVDYDCLDDFNIKH